jgi:integrase
MRFSTRCSASAFALSRFTGHDRIFIRNHRSRGLDCLGRASALGTPIQMSDKAEFKRLVAAAKVRPINFHGLRHTCATLMMLSGEAPKVVSERLGHSKIGMTLDIYSHVLPGMGRAAADRLGAVLHGS